MPPIAASRPLIAALASVMLWSLASTGWAQTDAAPSAADVEFFEKQVRPILAARCHECHGEKQQKASLRLDSRTGVLTGGDSGPAALPGKPSESLLVDAIRYGDTYQMPPKSQLPAAEIATLVTWVERGLPWGPDAPPGQPAAAVETFDLQKRAGHWSFQPITDPAPPDVADAAWVKTPLDRFILSKLAAAGLSPAPPAEKRALLRRVTYDLTGLPPTPQELAEFLADDSADAYRRVVDRLLASPRYGERWARHWLDLVRYAETYGHEFDFDLPNAYRYRDYVIRALNDDLPFDQFVVEHVAGDLVQPPRRNPADGTNESIVATGSFLLGEAKHSPVDVRQDEADRVDNQIDVFAKTFLGLTVSCARCHDHKFDAITTKDYYALAGYLQSSRYQQAFVDPPEQMAATLAALESLQAERRAAYVEFVRQVLEPRLAELSAKVAAGIVPATPTTTAPANELAMPRGDDWGGWTASGAAFGTRPLRPLNLVAEQRDGRDQLVFAGTIAGHSGRLSNRLHGVLRSPTFEIAKTKIHYRLHGTGGRARLILDGLQLIQDPIYGGLRFDAGGPAPHWHSQDVSKWVGHRAYLELIDDGDGYLALERVAFSDAAPPGDDPAMDVAAVLSRTGGDSPETAAEARATRCREVVEAWLAAPDAQHKDEPERAAIIATLLAAAVQDNAATAASARLTERLAEIGNRQSDLEKQITPPRQALALADGTAENERVFIRGNHKTLGDEVPRRFLEALGGTRHAPPDEGSGRLELARQLVAADNPLVKRVIVNRLWHHHFGAGIVRSVDDFGVMGQGPTHPELLDYLAQELERNGWSLKSLHRLVVLSNTYQMSSQPRPEADLADPTNKLWHRMSVRRLEAEAIRDAMLAVSGELDETMYGPSVMPYLTEHMTGRGRPKDSGPLDGGRRRSVYLAVRRNFLSPLFQAFDYPTPFTTIGRRGSSNVPAQALALMNNPLVVDQSRRWAERVVKATDLATPAARVQAMYLRALSREADPTELAAALQFVAPAGANPADPAAWSELAHVIYNLKEFIFIP
jgi:cytochrome c553